MARESEGWFALRDGNRLYEKTWEPSSAPEAHMIFLHGFSDRSEIQYHLFPTLTSPLYNITCHAIDQRGWGKSVYHPSHRGLTGPTSQVLTDIDEYITHVATTKIPDLKTTPLFIMGHSMGAQQLLHYLLTSPENFTTARTYLSGAIIEAPYIALDPSSEPSRFTVWAGKLAATVSPKTQMKQSLDSRYITRDPVVNAAWADDPLCHDYGTLQGLRDMLARAETLVELSMLPPGARSTGFNWTLGMGLKLDLPVPMLWAHGTEDRVTAFGPSWRLCQRICAHGDQREKVTFRAWKGAYHKIHAEPDGVGVEFSKQVAEWILGIVGPGTKQDVTGVGEGARLKAKL